MVGLGTGMGLEAGMLGGVVGGVLLGAGAGAIGYHVGKSQATRMRVAAQTALCQVAIERAIHRPEE